MLRPLVSPVAGIVPGLPLIVAGMTGHYNSTGTNEANYQWGLPAGVPLYPGMRLFYQQGRNTAGTPGAITASGTGQVYHAWVDRPSATIGEAATWSWMSTILTATDIANGYIVIPSLSNAMTLVGVILWRGVTITPSLDNVGTTSAQPSGATAGFNRAGSLNANTVNMVSQTPSRPSIAIACMGRGGGRRTLNLPGGWTSVSDIDTSIATPGRYPGRMLAKTVTGATGTDAWTFTGAADMTLLAANFLVAAA